MGWLVPWGVHDRMSAEVAEVRHAVRPNLEDNHMKFLKLSRLVSAILALGVISLRWSPVARRD